MFHPSADAAGTPVLRLHREPGPRHGGSEIPIAINGHPARLIAWNRDQWAASDHPPEAWSLGNGCWILLEVC